MTSFPSPCLSSTGLTASQSLEWSPDGPCAFGPESSDPLTPDLRKPKVSLSFGTLIKRFLFLRVKGQRGDKEGLYTHVYTYTRTYPHVCTCTHTSTQTYIHSYTHIYTYVCTRNTYGHTMYLHTHIQVYAQVHTVVYIWRSCVSIVRVDSKDVQRPINL